MFYLTTKDNEFIESQLWDRFIYEDGNFRGDNRSGEVLDGAFNRFMESNDLLFGKGLDYASSFGEGNSSYRLIVIAYGLIFAIISIIAFTILAYSISGNLRTTIEYMVVFIGMMYQRPNLYDISYFYILVISVYVLNFTRIHKSSMTIEEYSTNILIKG
jgi:hypothetical protein